VSAILLYRQEFNASIFDALRQVSAMRGDDLAIVTLRVLWALAANADDTTPDFAVFLRELDVGGDQVMQAILRVNQYAISSLLDLPRRPIADGKSGEGERRRPPACPDTQILSLACGLGLGWADWRHLRTSDVIDLLIDAQGLSYEKDGAAGEVAEFLDQMTVHGRVW
jgi:hypothetical protein